MNNLFALMYPTPYRSHHNHSQLGWHSNYRKGCINKTYKLKIFSIHTQHYQINPLIRIPIKVKQNFNFDMEHVYRNRNGKKFIHYPQARRDRRLALPSSVQFNSAKIFSRKTSLQFDLSQKEPY